MRKLLLIPILIFFSVLVLFGKEVKAQDIIPPSTIADLTAYRTYIPSSDKIILQWTAPGDDGNTGTTSSYDIRYSTSLITESNWNSATQATGESVPSPAGTKETFVVTGLNNSTNYYFAIKAADEVPNWSELSNVANRTTLLGVTAKSGSPEDIQAAVDAIAQSGGVVYIPEGDFSFEIDPNKTDPVFKKPVGIIIPGGISIIGAGKNKTILRQTQEPPYASVMFYVYGVNDKPVRITGITFIGNVTTHEDNTSSRAIQMYNAKDFRVDHCSFVDFSSASIATGIYTVAVRPEDGEYQYYWNRGVIDNCDIDNPYKDIIGGKWAYGILVIGPGRRDAWLYDINDVIGKFPDSLRTALYEWNETEGKYYLINKYGGKYFRWLVYIENNTFSRTRHAITSNSEAWYVARFNTFREPRPKNYGVIDVHGAMGADWWGGRGLEAFNNTIIGAEDYYANLAFAIRGGGGVIFNNTIINPMYGGYNYGVALSYEANETNQLSWVNDLWIWNNSFINVSKEVYDGVGVYKEEVNYFLRQRPNHKPYPYPHPLTLDIPENFNFIIELEKLTILERLIDTRGNPVNAIISVNSFTNTTDVRGYYGLTLHKGVYDILFNIANFFIENFWLKLLRVNISSIDYNKLTHITNYTEQKNISMIFNITGNQTIQTYSSEKPKRVLQNSTALKEYNSTADLFANYGWFYNETDKILYIKFNETVG